MVAKKKPAKKGGGSTKSAASSTKSSAEHKRQLFVVAYLANGGNATQAAKEAGFSEKTAYSAGGRLLKNVEVKASIEAAQREIVDKYELSLDRTLREIARLAYADPRKLYNADGSLKKIHELDDDTAATVSSIEVDEIGTDGVVIGHTRKIKHWDKNAALEKAMKFHGAYEKDNAQKQPVVMVVSPTDEDL